MGGRQAPAPVVPRRTLILSSCKNCSSSSSSCCALARAHSWCIMGLTRFRMSTASPRTSSPSSLLLAWPTSVLDVVRGCDTDRWRRSLGAWRLVAPRCRIDVCHHDCRCHLPLAQHRGGGVSAWRPEGALLQLRACGYVRLCARVLHGVWRW